MKKDNNKDKSRSKFNFNSRFKLNTLMSSKFNKIFKPNSKNINSFKSIISSISNKFDDLTGINENINNSRIKSNSILNKSTNNTNKGFNKESFENIDKHVNKHASNDENNKIEEFTQNYDYNRDKNLSNRKLNVDNSIDDKISDNYGKKLKEKNTSEKFIKHLNLTNKTDKEFLNGENNNKKFKTDKDVVKSINNIKYIRKNGLKNNNENILNNNNENILKNNNEDGLDLNRFENYDDSYYRTIEPRNEENKHQNYIKELKGHDLENENKNIDYKKFLNLDKYSIKNLKDSLNNDESKTVFGAAIFGLVIIVLLFSSYYFFFYQPFQDELALSKTNKLNELNSLFKGPLTLDPNVLALTSNIELATSPEEVNAVDVLRPATAAWKEYQTKQINRTKDDFNRVMLSYDSAGSNGITINNYNKNVIMNVADAQTFVDENDGNVLANVEIKKPDTVAVPILVTRLQAGGGLISVGTVVDIYTLSDSNSQVQSNENSPSDSSSNDNNTSDSSNDNIDSNSNNGEDNNINNHNNQNSQSNIAMDGVKSTDSESKIIETPDVSGSTVLAIMRWKDSGTINANYIKSQTIINGNTTNQDENSKSFSSDVEEMIRGSISGGYNEKEIVSTLNNYGLKLSDYERQSNLGELDAQYLLLIEVPREDVPYVINNMDNIILTIPTGNAPDWMVQELKSTYLK